MEYETDTDTDSMVSLETLTTVLNVHNIFVSGNENNKFVIEYELYIIRDHEVRTHIPSTYTRLTTQLQTSSHIHMSTSTFASPYCLQNFLNISDYYT